MFTVIVEKAASFNSKEIFTLERGDKSASVTHEVVADFEEKAKTATKKFSLTDSKKIFNAFAALDFSKIFKESGELIGCDGWTLRCTLRNGTNELAVELWCPCEDVSKPETTKLIKACELVESFFQKENL